MQVVTIKMSLKLSKETPAGWRGMELGAEATLAPHEDVTTAMAALYGQLRSEFVKLWGANGIANGSNGNGHKQEPAPEVAVGMATVETKAAPAPEPSKAEQPKQEPKPTPNEEPATPQQIKCIFGKAKAAGLPNSTVREMALSSYGVPIDSLTKKQAGAFITALSQK